MSSGGQECYNGTASVWTQTRELLVGQQAFGVQAGEHRHCRRTPRVVEESGYLAIALLDEIEESFVARVSTHGAVLNNSFDLAEHSITAPLQGERMHGAQQFPVGFLNCVLHRAIDSAQIESCLTGDAAGDHYPTDKFARRCPRNSLFANSESLPGTRPG